MISVIKKNSQGFRIEVDLNRAVTVEIERRPRPNAERMQNIKKLLNDCMDHPVREELAHRYLKITQIPQSKP